MRKIILTTLASLCLLTLSFQPAYAYGHYRHYWRGGHWVYAPVAAYPAYPAYPYPYYAPPPVAYYPPAYPAPAYYPAYAAPVYPFAGFHISIR